MTTTQPVAQAITATATYSLFDLIESADSIYINSVEAEEVSIECHYGDLKTLRLSCSDDSDYHFKDQQVRLLDTGEVIALDCEEDSEEPGNLYRLLLRVERPLSASDLIQNT